MPKITRSKDCGNSPKNKLAEEIAIALVTFDYDFLQPMLVEDFVFHQSAEEPLNVAAFEAEYSSKSDEITDLRILRVVTHGRAGAVNGVAKTISGDKHFCYVLEFTNTKCNKIGAITSYVLGT